MVSLCKDCIPPWKWRLHIIICKSCSHQYKNIPCLQYNHGYCMHGIFLFAWYVTNVIIPGHVVQSVTFLATDASLTANPGVASSIPARSHTFVAIDHENISTVILLPSAESFKKGCCQLQAKVCARSTG